jgi:hypothetical protein
MPRRDRPVDRGALVGTITESSFFLIVIKHAPCGFKPTHRYLALAKRVFIKGYLPHEASFLTASIYRPQRLAHFTPLNIWNS